MHREPFPEIFSMGWEHGSARPAGNSRKSTGEWSAQVLAHGDGSVGLLQQN